MAYSGTFQFNYALATIFTGSWETFDATRKNLTVDPPSSGVITGSANYTVGGNAQIELSDGPLGPDTYRLGDLPIGFTILTINRMGSGGIGDDCPHPFGGTGVNNNLTTNWAITEFGWTPGDSDITDLVQQMIWTAVNFTVDVSYDAAGGLQHIQAYSNNEVSGSYAVFTGTWDDSGAIPAAPEAPEVEAGPGEDEITITPGPGTNLLIVDDEVIPATPGVPIVVTVPGPITDVTPINTVTPGPTVTVATPLVLTMDAVIDINPTSPILAIANPSGIYTLVPGKLHDTLYERVGGVATTQDVAIPTPFARTSLVPEQD